jgi:hypothetical protein
MISANTNFEIKSNRCEICNTQAQAGILDDRLEGNIRYTCQDHYMALYEKMIGERKSKNDYKG